MKYSDKELLFIADRIEKQLYESVVRFFLSLPSRD